MGEGPFYNCPMAAVITNGVRSRWVFEVLRGSRQGCLLSPLLLALVIEQAIRCKLGHVGQKCDKITLYADDVLLFMSNPAALVHRLIQNISQFSAFSGYKIFLLLLSEPCLQVIGFRCLFTFLLHGPPQDLCIWAYSLHSSTRCSKPISSSWPSFIFLDLECWNLLPISWLGISLMKMSFSVVCFTQLEWFPFYSKDKWIV